MEETIETESTDERYTPEMWLKPWKDFFGPRFVDVANNPTNTTGAAFSFTKSSPARDGSGWVNAAEYHNCSWIWANVPYSRGSIMAQVALLVETWSNGELTVPMVWLLPCDPSSKWYQLLHEMAAFIAYPRQRIRFIGAAGQAGAKQPSQCVVVLPADIEPAPTRRAFVSAYGSMFTTVLP